MKDKNISDGIYIRSPGSCPRGGTWWYRGGLGEVKKNSEIQPDLVCELHTQRHNLMGPHSLGQKVKYH